MLIRSWLRAASVAGLALAVLTPAHAGLFNDDEARKAILDLRARTTSLESQLSAAQQALLEQNNQMVQLQQQTASLRGQNEELTNQLSIQQKTVKEYYAELQNQLQKLAPKAQAEDSAPADTAAPAAATSENEAYKNAVQPFQQGHFKKASTALRNFINNYPKSARQADAQYWLGNALYAQRDYESSNTVLRGLAKAYPTSPRAPEALLAVAQNQLEQKQKIAARQTLQRMIKQYSGTEAAQKAKTKLKQTY